MLAALFLFSFIWLGFVLDEEFSLTRGDFAVRFAAAVVLGCFWSTWLVFGLSLMFGFSGSVVLAASVVILAFNAGFARWRGCGRMWWAGLFHIDRSFWSAALAPVLVITGYFFVCVWTNDRGEIFFRGNTRDLAFHLSTVSAFLEQGSFPPLNPQSATAKLSYHFMANFASAILCKGGFTLYLSMKIPMVLYAFSLGTLTCYFLHSLLRARVATVFAAVLFFFGHIGVVNLLFGLAGYPSGSVPLSLTSWASVEDHLIYPYYNFLNVVIDFFQPQLPFLFAFPVAMLVLLVACRRRIEGTHTDRTTYFLLGTVALLPLFHMHTFITISPLVGVLVLLEKTPAAAGVQRRAAWLEGVRRWADAALATPDAPPPASPQSGSAPAHSIHRGGKILALFLAAVPVGLQLAFILSQKKTAGFSGFDVGQQLGALPEIPDFLHLKRIWFWVRAAGLPFVLGWVGVAWSIRALLTKKARDPRLEVALLLLFAATLVHFLVINFFRFTPNWGDSNKFFLYWDLVLCLYAGRWLALGWERRGAWRAAAVGLLAVGSVLPIGVEWVERCSRQPERLFSAADRWVADWIRLNTPGEAVFLSANSTVHLVPALAGRRVVNGSYTRETGYADNVIEELVARAYREADPSVIPHVNVTHIIVGPEEEMLYHVNRAKLERRHKLLFDQTWGGLRYTVYEVRTASPEVLARERAEEAARGFVWLSELEPSSVQQFGPLRFDKAFDLSPMRLQGRSFGSGLGTHAPSEITYALSDAYSFFEAEVGLDDSQTGGIGSVVFEVWLDDRLAYRSAVLRAGERRESVRVELAGARMLRLLVADAGDGNHCDHADWAGARLIKRAAD